MKMFKFDVLDADKSPLDAASILKQLECIVDLTHDQCPPIGLLTAQPRAIWAEIYSKLQEDETNAKSFHDIHSSLFMLSLDQTELAEDLDEGKFHEARLALCGGGSKRNSANRWHDKTFQIFIGSNGESGFAGEHSLLDGIFAQTLAETVSQSIENLDKPSSDSARSGLPCPQKLEFALRDDIFCAMSEAGKHIDQLFGRLPRVLESVSLLRFKLGRVENVKTVTEESTTFIKMFHDGNIKSADKTVMLHKALKVHVKGISDAQRGQGMERHLFGLQRIAMEKKIDASDFFDDASWQKSCSVDIRTTGLQGDASRAVYTPLIQTSCAFIYYCFNPDFINFAINIREDKTEIDVNKFLEELFACMLDLKDLLESVSHT